MDAKSGKFVMPETVRKLEATSSPAARERLASIYKMPTLAVGEDLAVKGLPVRVAKIKPSGGLVLRFTTPNRIGFGRLEPVQIKGVTFRATWTANDRVGLKMVKGA